MANSSPPNQHNPRNPTPQDAGGSASSSDTKSLLDRIRERCEEKKADSTGTDRGGGTSWDRVKAAIACALTAVWIVLQAGVDSLKTLIAKHRVNRQSKSYRCPVCDRIPITEEVSSKNQRGTPNSGQGTTKGQQGASNIAEDTTTSQQGATNTEQDTNNSQQSASGTAEDSTQSPQDAQKKENDTPAAVPSSDQGSYPDECNFCHTNNANWRMLSTWNHANRFPALVRLLVPGLLLLQGAATWYVWRSAAPPYAPAVRAVALLSLIASFIVVAMVFAFRGSLRYHDLLRRVKQEGKGLSLVALGGLTFALVLLLLASVSVLTFGARDFVMGGSWTLAIQGLEGSAQEVAGLSRARVSQPHWSPQGDKLLFSSDHDGDWEIYVYDIQAGKIITLTNNNDKDIDPTWLQDGSVIYASDRTGSLSWKKMDPAQKEKSSEDITSWHDTAELSWAPDGTRYAFTQPGRAIFFADQRLTPLIDGYPLIWSIVVSAAFPSLFLSVMLFGTAGYVKKIESEFHNPIFLNDRAMKRVAYDSFVAERNTSSKNSETTGGDTKDDSPRIVSSDRTSNGGLRMRINCTVKSQQEDEQGEKKEITKEVLYEVVTDPWARVKSTTKLDPRQMESKPS